MVNQKRQKYVQKSRAPKGNQHLSVPGDNFNLHVMLALTEQLKNSELDTELLT